MGAKQSLPHQEDLEEFSLFSSSIAQETLLEHGFVMLSNVVEEQTFPTATLGEP